MNVAILLILIFSGLASYLWVAAACYWYSTSLFFRSAAAVFSDDKDLSGRLESAGKKWFNRGERLTFGLLSHGGKR